MSHWVKVKLAVDDEDILLSALKRMGLEVLNPTKIREQVKLYDQESTVDIVLSRENGQATVGLVRQPDGSYQMVGDFWHAREGNDSLRGYYGKGVAAFQTDLQTAYCVEKAVSVVNSAGYEIEENEEGTVGEDGLITMVAVRYE